MYRIIVFANGLLPDYQRARMLLRPDDFIICADGGARHAFALDLVPEVVIGDFDSLSPDQIDKAESKGAYILRYPNDKNETDLELALEYALELKPSSILILGALGNRLDQTLGNIALLSDKRLALIDVRFDDGLEEACFCRSRSELNGGAAGDIISLIPWCGPALGVRTVGLKWPLNNETLYPEKTRGISNELLGESASVSLSSGSLFVIHRRMSNIR